MVKILIVEDEDTLAKIIEWRLTNIGHEVVGRAATAKEALELTEKTKPQLVLMDINLKGYIDGIEVTTMIKEQFKTPVIYLTSHFDGKTISRAKATKPEGFILKPFNDKDLEVAIKLALK